MRPVEYAEIVARALIEDLGERGDITSAGCVPADATSRAALVARRRGVIAGLDVAGYVFTSIDASVRWDPLAADGATVDDGSVVAVVAGSSRSLLAAERTALNFLGRMSGVATATAELVDLVAGTGAKISDTRKTMPGLRVLDKYAVRMGGGMNHRFGLYDAVLIKDNHLAAAGSIAAAVAAAKRSVGPGVMVEVEVETLDQVAEALQTEADRLLFDNMDPDQLGRAVEMVSGRKQTEASGGVTRDNLRAVAESGVDIISVGWITHSAPQLDLALDFGSGPAGR